MKKWLAPLMLGFGVAMAVIIGERMSTDAMAIVIGVAVGVAASIPTSLLLVALLRRERKPWGNINQGQQAQQPVVYLSMKELLEQTQRSPSAMIAPPPQGLVQDNFDLLPASQQDA